MAQREGWVQVSPRETFRWTTPFFDLQFVDIKKKRRKRSSSRPQNRSGDRTRSQSRGKGFYRNLLEIEMTSMGPCTYHVDNKEGRGSNITIFVYVAWFVHAPFRRTGYEIL